MLVFVNYKNIITMIPMSLWHKPYTIDFCIISFESLIVSKCNFFLLLKKPSIPIYTYREFRICGLVTRSLTLDTQKEEKRFQKRKQCWELLISHQVHLQLSLHWNYLWFPLSTSHPLQSFANSLHFLLYTHFSPKHSYPVHLILFLLA